MASGGGHSNWMGCNRCTGVEVRLIRKQMGGEMLMNMRKLLAFQRGVWSIVKWMDWMIVYSIYLILQYKSVKIFHIHILVVF